MDTLFLCNTKTLKEKINTKIFAGDNLITKINVQLPDNIGGYPKRECEFNLRAIIPEGNLSYIINPAQPYFYVTSDITEKAQTVKLMMIITHEGNVIGRTNTVDLIVNEPAEAPDPPLTPREEFDTVIREQRQTIQEQSQTISTQGETITQQGEQITELSGEVTELNTENEQLETQHTADQNTIQYLIENPPEVRLQSKSVNPTSQMQTVEPDSGYGGLSSVTVGAVTPPRLQGKAVNPSFIMQNIQPDSGYDGLSNVAVGGVTAEIDSDIQPENIKEGVEILGVEGTYNPFPEQSYGGIYVLSVDEDGRMEDVLVEGVDYGKNENTDFQISGYLLPNYAKSTIKSLIFKNCKNMGRITNFRDYGIIEKATIQGFFKTNDYVLEGCGSLKELRLESPLQYLGYSVANGCENLETIYLANTITSVLYGKFMPGGTNAKKLKNVILENGFQLNGLQLQQSTLYSQETIVSWLEALADRTGETAYTLTIGTPNINKLTAEQKAIATNKNWNLA